MNCPKRPTLITIGEPHFSHFSSVVGSCLPTILIEPLGSLSKFCVFLHGGSSLYPGHARNFPLRPNLISIIRPPFSERTSVGVSTVSLCPGGCLPVRVP